MKEWRMKDGRVTVWIGEREALPVRAIPYVTSWQVSPDSVVRAFAELPTIKVGTNLEIRNKHSLVAYQTHNQNQYQPIPASQWKDSAVALNSLTKKLMADEREGANGENHGPWRLAAILKLPDNAFVWLDEFQSWYSTTRPMIHREGDAIRMKALKVELKHTDSDAENIHDQETELFQSADDSLCLSPILPPEITGKVWQYGEATGVTMCAPIPVHASPAITESLNTTVTGGARITVNRIGNRTNILEAVILQATEKAALPKDVQCIWVEIVRLAESNERPAPLLGFVDDEGVKYQASGGVKFFTRKNLSDRMGRAKRAKAR